MFSSARAGIANGELVARYYACVGGDQNVYETNWLMKCDALNVVEVVYDPFFSGA